MVVPGHGQVVPDPLIKLLPYHMEMVHTISSLRLVLLWGKENDGDAAEPLEGVDRMGTLQPLG